MLNPLYTYVLGINSLVWFGLDLWHINHCRLFNAKSSLYICIRYIWFGLVGLGWVGFGWVGLGFMANQPLYVIQC